MSNSKRIDIDVIGTIDKVESHSLVLKIQTALKNKVKEIHLTLQKDTAITSADFIGYLVLLAQKVTHEKMILQFHGVEEKNRILFKLSKLDSYIVNS